MSNVISFPTLPPRPIDPDLAELDFEPIPAIRARTPEERNVHTRNLSQRVYNAAGVAVALLALTKPELVEVVRSRDGRGLIDELDAAAFDAETLAEFISTASNRVMVAIAVIESDGGGEGMEGGTPEGNRISARATILPITFGSAFSSRRRQRARRRAARFSSAFDFVLRIAIPK
jgi:hypothetical protein